MEIDKTNNKVITVSFVVAAFLAHLVTRVLFETLAGSFAVVAKARAVDVVQHGLPLVMAFGLFAALQLNPKVRVWADEVVTEIRKIVWPSRKDTWAMTVVVCVMVVIAGLGLAVFDYVSSVIIKWIVN